MCSTAKTGLVRSLGAAHVIDYTREDFADGTHRYDLIIDIAGNPSLAWLRRAHPRRDRRPHRRRGRRPADRHGAEVRVLALSPFLRQPLTMLTPGSARPTFSGSPSSSRQAP